MLGSVVLVSDIDSGLVTGSTVQVPSSDQGSVLAQGSVSVSEQGSAGVGSDSFTVA